MADALKLFLPLDWATPRAKRSGLADGPPDFELELIAGEELELVLERAALEKP